MAEIYYPALSNILSLDTIPSELSFIREQLEELLSELKYSNYIAEQSLSGNCASYSLNVVLSKPVSFDILGESGLALVFNPDVNDTTITSIPITIEYIWEIAKFFKLDFRHLGLNPLKYLQLFAAITEISKKDVLLALIFTIDDAEEETESEFDENEAFRDFTETYNTLYSQTPLTMYDAFERWQKIELILEHFIEHNQSFYEVIFMMFFESISTFDDCLSKIKQLFKTLASDVDFDDLQTLITPKVSALLNNITLALEFPRKWLIPIDPQTNQPIEDENEKSKLTFTAGTIRFSTENGLEFENESNFSFQKSQIGKTGISLQFQEMKLDLSRTRNIPEATAAGYPDDFAGVFVKSAEIGLPEKWFQQITSNNSTLGIFGENLLLGTGGISGTFGLRAIENGKPTNIPIPNGVEMQFKLGGNDGFIIGFSQFDFSLQMGNFQNTTIRGSLQIPGFKDADGNIAKIGVEMSFGNEGDFYITAAETDGIPAIHIPGVLEVTLKSVSVGRLDDRFYLSVSGSIEFTGDGMVSSLFNDPLEIDELRIWQDGTIELKGLDGAFKLKEPKTLSLGPADITVTAIHFGTDERMHGTLMRKYWYFGFDGGISVNPGGVDARGDGVKVYFTVDNNGTTRKLHVFFRIQSLSIDLIIPSSASSSTAVAIISGYLAMKEPESNTPDDGTEYIGGISLSLPKLNIMASAGMRYKPSVPAFLVDVSLDLPMAIPLGPTGIGIYGFRGLLGQRYVASRREAGVAEDGSWYEYYKAKVSPDYREGIQVSKFAQEKGFSVGAGVSLATAFDSGKVFSAKVFVLLSIPEVLLIQGQGAILKERVGLDTTTDPPFSAMIAISSDSIEAAFGANINIPDGGQIAKVSGAIEMGFFFANSGAWYVNLGRDLPEEKRIRVELFTLFNAYFYFMLSKQGIAAGAGAHWDFNKRLGPLRVSAFAYLDVAGKIAFKPVQIGGSIALGAGASLGIWKLCLGLEIHAFLAAEAPQPFIITGALSFKLNLPRPIRKLGGPYSLEFTWSFDKHRDVTPIDLIDTNNAVRAVHQLTGETYPLYYSTNGNEANNMTPYVIPVDSFIDIEFLKAMGIQNTPGLKKFGVIGQGSHNTELVPPQKGKSQQVQHEFRLEDIVIEYKNGNSWSLYDMYQGIRPASTNETEITFPANTDNMLCGYWQCDTKDKHQKLRIFAQSPLSYLTRFKSGLPILPEDLGYQEGFLFCEGQLRPKTCVTFPVKGQLFRAGVYTERQRVLICVLSSNGWVIPRTNSFGLQNALNFKGKAEFFFEEPQAKVVLRLSSYAEEVRISYFYRQQVSNNGFANLPVYETIQITEKIITPAVDGNVHTIVYSHSDYNNAAVEFITIESIGGVIDNSNLLTEEPEFLVQENSGTLLLEDAQEHFGATQLFSICTLTVGNYNYNISTKTQTEVDETVHAMHENFTTHINPIWRPNTLFRIKIATYDALPKENVHVENYKKNHYFFFKTVGPLGHFHEQNKQYQSLLALGREDQFKLATLKPYIDYSRSYPNADGRLTNAKPLFYYNPKLLMFYTENSIYAMYNDFAPYGNQSTIYSKLNVLIKDPTETIATDPDNPTHAIPGFNSWKKNPDAIMTPEVRMLNNLANNGANCAGFEEFTPLSVMQQIEIGTLRPDTLYTAVFNAEYRTQSNQALSKTQVHSYVFKTSQYADFTAQVQSCILRDDAGNEVRKAVFTLEKEFDTNTIAKATTLLGGNLPQTDPLVNAYANEFNRLTDGILQLGVLPPATSTDFTIVKNSSANTIAGIIVRNPEPFNDPKIPVADLSDTIRLLLGGTSNYKVIFSADNTQAFISNVSMNVPGGTARFTFRYKQYDMTTKTYKVLVTERVEIEV